MLRLNLVIKMNFLWILVIFSNALIGQIDVDFDPNNIPTPPNYGKQNAWAALPYRVDACDHFDRDEMHVHDSSKQVDVFFIHPTTYSKGERWNADIEDVAINKATDKKPMKYQASVFSQSCRIYAPRYRQAILKSFYDVKNGEKALELAYSDVKAAFEYYLENYNGGRPIIIASHSQGTFHAKKLLKEFFDDKPLKNKLVMAYLVGYAVSNSDYNSILECANSQQTGGIVSWNCFKSGFIPDNFNSFYRGAICTNPVTWETDTSITNLSSHLGAKGYKMNSRLTNKLIVQRHPGILWVKINYPIIKKKEVLHFADYNLFWYDIQADIKRRIGLFWK